jgi:hypothetical protein
MSASYRKWRVAKEELGLHNEAKEDFFKSLSLCNQEFIDKSQ